MKNVDQFKATRSDKHINKKSCYLFYFQDAYRTGCRNVRPHSLSQGYTHPYISSSAHHQQVARAKTNCRRNLIQFTIFTLMPFVFEG